MSNPPRISTGIAGLDDVLMGGFIKSGFYLIQGDPGAGKTTMALQYALGRVSAGEKVLYVSLTETRDDLQNAAASHRGIGNNTARAGGAPPAVSGEPRPGCVS